jgi:copper chaperone
MRTDLLSVPDISCSHCERAIKDALAPLDGVASIHVDVPGKTVRVHYDADRVSIDQITRAIEDEEYPVAAVEPAA